MISTPFSATTPTGTGGATGAGSTGGTGATSGSSATTGSNSGGSSANSLSSATTLGGTDFLTLMLAQLQNQDPTSPVDANNFLSQLASLSEVQGITQLNTSFSTLSNSLVSGQALQASTLLGHQALVPSSTATLASAGASISGAVNVPQTSSSVVLNITNGTGVLVQSINLGAQSAGLANFSWNGQMANGSAAPAGTYSLSAQVAGTSGGTAVGTLVNGTVQSVTMGAGSSGLTLNIAGLGSVPFSSVQQISN
ncbi:MAG TPA: flagellar hook capping FlgD N-terminal domain-containing protein [Steroidobacteraceae bacterium]|nr:flagellar hook capping FlgD N-terminal domain-containing protein [Steroidobacteraceae bacterium]